MGDELQGGSHRDPHRVLINSPMRWSYSPGARHSEVVGHVIEWTARTSAGWISGSPDGFIGSSKGMRRQVAPLVVVSRVSVRGLGGPPAIVQVRIRGQMGPDKALICPATSHLVADGHANAV